MNYTRLLALLGRYCFSHTKVLPFSISRIVHKPTCTKYKTVGFTMRNYYQFACN